MLSRRTRKQIEWHFYNYAADLAVYEDKAEDIYESGLTARFGRIGGQMSGVGNPTESKAIRLETLEPDRNWVTVVRNVFTTFQFTDSYPIMKALYIDHRELKDILCDGIWETTFYRWRDEWLECAQKWAENFQIL